MVRWRADVTELFLKLYYSLFLFYNVVAFWAVVIDYSSDVKHYIENFLFEFCFWQWEIWHCVIIKQEQVM